MAGVHDLSFQYLLGKLFIPVAYLMGVPSQDAETVARLVGTKTVVNEFVAFSELGELKKNEEISYRAQVIATFALCGFANPGNQRVCRKDFPISSFFIRKNASL